MDLYHYLGGFMSTCIECKSEIPADALRCKHCGAKTQAGKKKSESKTAWTILVILIVLVVAGGAFGLWYYLSYQPEQNYKNAHDKLINSYRL